MRYGIGIIGIALTLVFVSYGRFSIRSAEAAPDQQGINQLPLELYILLNQPGPLWLARIDLESVDLGGARLTGANLRQARLTSANLRGTNLVGANLDQTNLNNANLIGSSLQGASLVGASMLNSDLRGADLTLVNMKGANVTGARYDIATIWPAGFDPVAGNARLIQPTPTARPATPTATPVP